METNIDRIAAKARKESKACFTSLAHHITKELLWENLNKIPKQTGVGIDEQNVQSAKLQFNKWSTEMIQAVHRRGYKPLPARRVYIPKPGKTQKRPIAVPTVADRALQRATAQILNAIYEQDFLNCSFGGRPHKSAHQALATLQGVIMNKKVNWIYEVDLKNYFGSLNHKVVERFIKHRVKDPRILTLIRRWLKAGVMEEGKYQPTEEGASQGGPISVLISNIYLHYVLDLWIEKVVKRHMTGEVYYLRYIDDFVVCFQYQSDATRFQKALTKRLAKFFLEAEPDKTRLIEFGRSAGHKGQTKKMQTLYFLGFTMYCTKSRTGKFKLGRKTEKTRLRRSHAKMKALIKQLRHFSVKDQEKTINRALIGHYQYYGIGGNIASLYRLYCFVVREWKRSLSLRSQKGKVNWEKYKRMLERYPLKKPKIVLPYRKMTELAML